MFIQYWFNTDNFDPIFSSLGWVNFFVKQLFFHESQIDVYILWWCKFIHTCNWALIWVLCFDYSKTRTRWQRFSLERLRSSRLRRTSRRGERRSLIGTPTSSRHVRTGVVNSRTRGGTSTSSEMQMSWRAGSMKSCKQHLMRATKTLPIYRLDQEAIYFNKWCLFWYNVTCIWKDAFKWNIM